MNPEIMQAIIHLVAEQIGVAPAFISAATRLAEDLYVDGDDASELLEVYALRFHVDLSEFEFARHFGPEAGWSPFHALAGLFAKSRRLEPVTIGELAAAAEKRVWSYPSQQLSADK